MNIDNFEPPPDYDTCSELDIGNLPCNFQGLIKDNLTFLNVNIRSLKANFHHLCAFLTQLKCPIKVIVVTESYLDDSIANLYNIPSYTKIAVNRPTFGGGIAAYIHNSIQFDADKKHTGIFPSHESLAFKITCPNKQVINFVCIYRPPNCHLNTFVTYLHTLQTKFFKRKLIILGDINVCPKRDASSDAFKSYWDFLATRGYRQLVKLPTYYSYMSNPSILDHIWTNIELESNSFVFQSPISDHIPVITMLNLEAKFPDVELSFRDFSLKNKLKFLSEIDIKLANLNDYLFSYIHTIDDSFEILSEWLIAACNAYFPIRCKTISNRRFKSPWLTSSLIKLIRKNIDSLNFLRKNLNLINHIRQTVHCLRSS